MGVDVMRWLYANQNSEHNLQFGYSIADDIRLQLMNLLESRSNSLYFGWTSIIKRGSFFQIESPWGWKDPRNTFTASIWKEVFPDLKEVYIIRHPIDIAESLFKRQRKVH